MIELAMKEASFLLLYLAVYKISRMFQCESTMWVKRSQGDGWLPLAQLSMRPSLCQHILLTQGETLCFFFTLFQSQYWHGIDSDDIHWEKFRG